MEKKEYEIFIDALEERFNNLETMTVEELREYIRSVSVEDNIASSEAITVLYSGESDVQMKNLADYAGSTVRMLDHTDAYRLLTDSRFKMIVDYAIRCENPGISAEKLEELRTDVLYAASTDGNESNSFWSIISRRFASETTGDVYALIPNANPERIFEMDELVILMQTLSNDATINGVQVSELKQLNETDLFKTLKDIAISDFENTTIYFNDKGQVVGRSFDNTPLADVFTKPTEGSYNYSMNYRIYNNLDSTDVMISKCGENSINSLSEIELLKAKEIVYIFENDTPDIVKNSDWEHYAKVYDDYLKGSGKTVDTLNSADEFIIDVLCDHKINTDNSLLSKVNQAIDKIGNSDKLNKIVKELPLEKIGKFADVGGLAFDVLIATYDIYVQWPEIEEALANGDTNKAASLVVGMFTDATVTVVGEAVISSVVVPALMGIGFAVGGPAGAAIGALIGGVASGVIGDMIGNMAGDIAADLTDLFGMIYDQIEAMEDQVYGEDKDDILFGGAGNDSIYGYAGDDKLYGGADEDLIEAGSGSDLLVGGKGNDRLKGDIGNDRYVFNIGDGTDVITEYEASEVSGKADTIAFGPGISLDNVDIQRVGDSLVIKYGEEDKVLVGSAYYYRDGMGFVENIEFVDGTKLTVEDIANIANHLHGTDESDIIGGYSSAVGYNANEVINGGAGNDTLYGYEGNDELHGESGNDTLKGGVDDDTLQGGIGNDWLYGELGDDTYVFNIGDGIDVIKEYENSGTLGRADKIVFGEGITLDNVNIQRYGDDLVIKYGEEDQVIVEDAYYYTDGTCFVENIEFADGTKLTVEDIANIANHLYGTDESEIIGGYGNAVGYNENETIKAGAGDDIIYGYEGNDTIHGESGNDILNGGVGDDAYVFNIGDGVDVIKEYENSDTLGRADKIVFGEGITLDNVNIQRYGDDLVINYGEGDQVMVEDAYYYTDGKCFVENIEFVDGTKLTVEDIANIANHLNGTAESDIIGGYSSAVGYNKNEVINGGAGNDTLYGYEGNDTLYGESGKDTLKGGVGDDTLHGDSGNDWLYGEVGNDAYVFNIGDGVDIIEEYENSETTGRADKIVFGEGITLDTVDIQRSGDDLVIKYGEGDQVTVEDAYYYKNGICFVENIEFADGTKLTVEDIANIANHLYGTDESETIGGYGSAVGYNQNETIKGGAGDDTLYGYEGNDTLYGELGNDTLKGGVGNDTLYGDSGNDSLNGEAGDDIYVFNIGDGVDIINEYENSDTTGRADKIVFGEGITLDNVDIQRSGYDLVIKYGEGDQVTVEEAYYKSGGEIAGIRFVENIEFADGTKLTVEDIANIANQLHGTEGAETIGGYGSAAGYNQNETIKSGAGNDTLYGYEGNDTLHGESGNDSLNGGVGDDTYVFNIGDGVDIINEYENSDTLGRADKIVFGEGITLDNVDIQRSGYDLVIKYGEGDQVTVEDAYYYTNGTCFVENIEFADGTKLTVEDIANIANHLHGTDESEIIGGYGSAVGYNQNETIKGGAGDDTLYGYEGNDTLHGESGNDTLKGGVGDDTLHGDLGNDSLNGEAGDDTYVFNIGDGVDVIKEYENSDTTGRADKIVFGEGITLESVDIQRSGYDLVIKYGEGDQVTVEDVYYYTNGNSFVENIEFADGTKGTFDHENVLINITTQEIVEEETIVNECVEELQTVYSNEESIGEITTVTQKNEEVSELYDSSTGVNVDNMVNQLVQDMSEVTELTVSDSSVLNNAATTTDTYELWD